jgi:hypothetical protein
LDVFTDDPEWADWSERMLDEYSQNYPLFVNPVIYTEVSIGFDSIELLERTLQDSGIKMLAIPRAALFLAGKVFIKYRKQTGKKTSPLPDFYIGAQAAVLELPVLTRDTRRYSYYFPTVQLIGP